MAPAGHAQVTVVVDAAGEHMTCHRFSAHPAATRCAYVPSMIDCTIRAARRRGGGMKSRGGVLAALLGR